MLFCPLPTSFPKPHPLLCSSSRHSPNIFLILFWADVLTSFPPPPTYPHRPCFVPPNVLAARLFRAIFLFLNFPTPVCDRLRIFILSRPTWFLLGLFFDPRMLSSFNEPCVLPLGFLCSFSEWRSSSLLLVQKHVWQKTPPSPTRLCFPQLEPYLRYFSHPNSLAAIISIWASHMCSPHRVC